MESASWPEHPGPRWWRARWAAGGGFLVALALCGCGEDAAGGGAGGSAAGSGGTGGLFGGVPTPVNPEGGDANAAAGAGGAGGDASEPGRCDAVPESSEPRVDNFEDGDTLPIVEPGRLGAWHLPPLTGAQQLSFEIESEGADASDFAAHVSVDGFSERVSVTASLRFDQAGVACPYNAGGYAGLAFYAKGTGNIDLLLETTDTWSTEFGGSCDAETELCWDVHHKLVPLTAEWEYHEVRWDLFSQAGWGKLMAFDAQHLLGVSFAVAPGALPAELWLDEIRFVAP